jgi:hypothetical protein
VPGGRPDHFIELTPGFFLLPKATFMTPRHYHAPPPPASTRVRCPVCHQAVYSPAGIHPQCAIRQSDPPRPKTKPSPGTAHTQAVTGASEQVETVGEAVGPTTTG